MNWYVNVGGEHAEGLESGSRFDVIVGEFIEKLRANGFKTEFPAFGVCAHFSEPIIWNEVPLLAEEEELAVEPSGEGEVVEDAEPLTTAQIKQRIREEKSATGGNKILSQAELAERIGVSRYQIQKALK